MQALGNLPTPLQPLLPQPLLQKRERRGAQGGRLEVREPPGGTGQPSGASGETHSGASGGARANAQASEAAEASKALTSVGASESSKTPEAAGATDAELEARVHLV